MRETSVLVVGGGPVGLSAALCLGRMGIPCVVIERDAWVTDHPKARGVNKRTMELFRAWGIAGEVARRALPPGSARFIYCRSLAGEELCRTADPGWDDAISPVNGAVASQDVVEEVLVAAARSCPSVEIVFSAEVVSLSQTGCTVTAAVRRIGSGETEEIAARFAIAADGATSPVRHWLGIGTEGPGLLGWFASVYYRADLSELVADRPSAVYFMMDGGNPSGGVFSVNGNDRWITMSGLGGPADPRPELPGPEHFIAMARRLIGRPDQQIEILDTAIWGMGATVANQFQVGRIFLAGDAAHRLPPTGGFGMNSGIQDAHNLAWKLAMVLRGEASEALLATYHDERRPIAQSNIAWSLSNAQRFTKIGEVIAAGDQAEIDRLMQDQLNHLQPNGQDLGFRYDSGVVIADGTPARPWGGRPYEPSDRPGNRYPHAWLDRDSARISTLDLLGNRFTLLAGAGAARLAAAGTALAGALPLDVHQFTSQDTIPGAEANPAGAVLVRPDGHVAWRALSEPADPEAAIRGVMQQLLWPS